MAVKLEKERKFLLKYVPVEIVGADHLYLSQWYAGEKRYRRQTPIVSGQFQKDECKRFLTIKKQVSPGVNEEDETEIGEEEYLEGRAEGEKFITKRRYEIPAGDGLKWELDSFVCIHLILLEIELPELDQMPDMPEWLSRAVVKEVTGDKAFSNASLAVPRVD